MYHPLLPDLGEFTDDELMKKYNELNTKWAQANRAGTVSVLQQMATVLECYRIEIRRRQEKLLQEVSSRNPSFKNIIDIK